MLHLMLLYMCSDFTRRSIFWGGPHHLTKYMALLPTWFMWKIEKPAWYDNSVSSGFEITIQFCVIETWLKQWSSAHEVILLHLLLTLFSSLANRQHLCRYSSLPLLIQRWFFNLFFRMNQASYNYMCFVEQCGKKMRCYCPIWMQTKQQ